MAKYFTEKDLPGLNIAFAPVYEWMFEMDELRVARRDIVQQIETLEARQCEIEDRIRDIATWDKIGTSGDDAKLAASEFLRGFYTGWKEKQEGEK